MSSDSAGESKIENQKSKRIEEPWTVKRLRAWTAEFLAKKGLEEAEKETSILLAHALGWPRLDLYMRQDEEPPEDARQRFRDLVKRRVEGCPTAYLVGSKEFFSLAFEVSPAVLIPRPDTEWMVTEFVRLAKEMAECSVLDVGTGSGCLAVAAARQHRAARVTATDISPEALAVAARNAAKHGVAERITFLEGDLFGPLPAGATFDFILSNPPYVADAEFEQLARDVRDFEPRLALSGGPDGFAVLGRLFEQARGYLKPGGYLLIEIGFAQEEAARARLAALPDYEVGKTVHDAAGHPRVLSIRRQP
jgi:release factor glutamine methyltransferase